MNYNFEKNYHEQEVAQTAEQLRLKKEAQLKLKQDEVARNFPSTNKQSEFGPRKAGAPKNIIAQSTFPYLDKKLNIFTPIGQKLDYNYNGYSGSFSQPNPYKLLMALNSGGRNNLAKTLSKQYAQTPGAFFKHQATPKPKKKNINAKIEKKMPSKLSTRKHNPKAKIGKMASVEKRINKK